MTGIKKFFLAFFLILFFVIGTSIVLVKFFLPSKVLKNYAQLWISEIIGGKTEIKEVSASFRGFILNNIKIIFPDKSDIVIKKVIISPIFFPLVRKQLTFNKIEIINPVIQITKGFNLNKKFVSPGYTLLIGELVVENGRIDWAKLDTITNLHGIIKNVSFNRSLPIQFSFNVNDIPAMLKAEYNFTKQQLRIQELVFNSTKKNLAVTGIIKKLFNLSEMSFNLYARGNGELFNNIFLASLYKTKIVVFKKANINLNIYGDLKNLEIKNENH
ncbi:MAG: hypothetical protein AB1349_00295 [Elusimicrobiota bacterium]